MKTLYSTREKVPVYSFLTSRDEKFKRECELDIPRMELFVGDERIQDGNFEDTRSTIQAKAEDFGIEKKDAKYFSLLMTSLCNQSLLVLQLKTLHWCW